MPDLGDGRFFMGAIFGAEPLTGIGLIMTSGLPGIILSGSPGI